MQRLPPRGCAPHSLLSCQKRTLQRGFSCPFGAIHLLRRARWKRKPPPTRSQPKRPASCEHGGRANRSGGNRGPRLPCAGPVLRRVMPPHNGCSGHRGGNRIELLLFPLPLTWLSSNVGPAAHRRRSQHPGSAWRSRRRGDRSTGKSDDHPAYPPHGLCGSRVFQPPGEGAGSAGPASPGDRFARPPSHERAARMGRPFVNASFPLDRARPVSFSARRKGNGGCIPRETPAPGGRANPPHSTGQRISLATGV